MSSRRPEDARERTGREPSRSMSAGHVLGDFRLVRLVGRGATADVWEARQRSLNRTVALKVLCAERAHDPEALERFRREGHLASRNRHPGLVAVHLVDEHGGVPFIAQEWVEGARTLADRVDELRRTPELPPDHDRDTARIFLAIGEALEAAHSAGVLHCDIKPSNVLLTADGRPLVSDFGLARREGERPAGRSGVFAGTPAYASPEQAAGRELGPRSDVFSLGATLYETLTLRRPFQGATSDEVLRRVEQAAPLDPRRVRPRLARDLAAICLKAMARRPENRYASMAELAEDLRRFLGHESVRAHPPGPLRRAASWSRRHPVAAVALALGTVSVAVIGLASSRTIALQGEAARLADAGRLEQLVARASDPWPACPEHIEDYEQWLSDAEALRARLPLHERTLQTLERGYGRATAIQGSLTRGFSSAEVEWQRNILRKLVDDLHGFLDPEHGLVAEVQARAHFARSVEELTIKGETARRSWQEAITSIGSVQECPMYAGLSLPAQLGLLPVGRDPRSGLWEFAHLQTGTPPQRDPRTGELAVTAETGLVLILLPGGSFWMGAQNEDPGGRNYDRFEDAVAADREGPVHAVDLDPFFLSKWEMTQGQWARVTHENPSQYAPGHAEPGYVHDLRHPVESVSWTECDRVLRNLDLELPTEAQWEYAARAGTTTPWSTGSEKRSMIGCANLADQAAARAGQTWPAIEDFPGMDDGYVRHAPVGSLEPNPFGFHDLYGNVQEWCRNWIDHYNRGSWGRGDGLHSTPEHVYRACRGGYYGNPVTHARSATRSVEQPANRSPATGLRPARALRR